jgi:hypothetical protein
MQENRFKLTAGAAALAAMAPLAAPGVASASTPAQPGPLFVVAQAGNVPSYVRTWGSPLVVRNAAGHTVVAYQAYDSDGINRTTAQVLNADGSPAGAAFNIGTRGFGASLAMDKDGDFVAAWYDSAQGSYYGNTVYAQRYNAAGVAQGNPIKIATVKGGALNLSHLAAVKVAMDDDGDFTVAWTRIESFGIPIGYAKLVLSEGSKTYAEVRRPSGSILKFPTVVDSVSPRLFTVSYHDNPYFNADVIDGLAMNGKGNAVMAFDVWRNAEAQTGHALLLGPALSSKSSLLTLTDVSGTYDGVGIDASGNFDVAWEDASIYVSRYASDGSPLGATPAIAAVDALERATLSVAPSGEFAVSWGAAGDTESYVKRAQYFHADGTADGASFVIDDGATYQNTADMAAGIDGLGNLLAVWTTMPNSSTVAVVGRTVTAPVP